MARPSVLTLQSPLTGRRTKMVRVPEPIFESIIAVLHDAGPMTEESLLSRLADLGHQLTPAEFDDIWLNEELESCAMDYLAGPPLLFALDAVFMGRVFTHRLSAAEIAGGHLDLTPDLLPLWGLMDQPPFDELDGRPFEQIFEHGDIWIALGAGTLADRTPGDLIGVRVTPTGLQLEDVGETVDLPPEVTEVVAALFDDDDEYVPQIELDDVVQHLMLRYPDLFSRPTVPLEELIDELGLERRGDFVTVAGAGWDDDDAAAALDVLIRAYELDAEQALTVRAFARHTALAHGALHEWEDAGRPAELPAEFEVSALIPLLPALAAANVARAVLAESAANSEHRTLMLRSTLDALAPRAPRRAQPAVHWLLGSCADRLLDIATAEAEWETSIRLGSDFAPALIDLAGIASDRGDAPRAVSLLQRAGVEPDDSLLAMVSQYLSAERTDIGRNSPCWCGSGRKYKACHLRNSSFTLGERRDWLYHKVSRWVQASWGRPLLIDLARVRAEYWTQPTALFDALTDPLLLDVAIFEGDGLGEFLEARGSLLPADEQLLAASWLTSQRSLFEVTAVQRGQGFSVRDLRTGDVHDVVERLGSQDVRVGHRLCLRLLGAGDAAPGIFGGIDPVPDHLTAATLGHAGPAEHGRGGPAPHGGGVVGEVRTARDAHRGGRSAGHLLGHRVRSQS